MNNFLFNVFNQVGTVWILFLLLILSVISLAIIFERFRSLHNQERVGFSLWRDQIEAGMKSGELSLTSLNVPELTKKYPCIEADLLQVLGASKSTDSGDLQLLLASFLGRKKIELERNLAFLGTLGSNAPFIGLFGTVLGIIEAFHEIGSNAGEAGAQGVSLGLSEALVATAIGLLVAIPAVMAFNFFQRKIKTIVARAESLGNFAISSRKQ